MEKIGIFSPYLDTASGGERYVGTIAECLSNKGYSVDLFWHDKTIKKKLTNFLRMDLDNVTINNELGGVSFSIIGIFRKWRITKNYKVFFFLSDGSVPLLFSKNNFLLFQNPFPKITPNISNKIKLMLYKKIVCNSHFTKSFVDKQYGVRSIVIFPPVDIDRFIPLEKNNTILNVGRFVWNKKQDILIDTFKQMCDSGLKNWNLILTGSTFGKNTDYFNRLKEMSTGYPIKVIKNPSFDLLTRLYGISKIYWHATGFGENIRVHPEYTEHFGIATVEAMSAGNVPVVINLGGQPEIVKDEDCGYLWNNINELKSKTLLLINAPGKLKSMSIKAKERSRLYSKQTFYKNLIKII